MLQKSIESLFYVDCDQYPFIRTSHLSEHVIIVPSSSDNRGCTVFRFIALHIIHLMPFQISAATTMFCMY